MTIKMLVSVRSVEEAVLAARGGAHFIDLKEPRAGALGGLAIGTIDGIVKALRRSGSALPISATIGDLPTPLDEAAAAQALAQVRAVAECGVTYVKVGVERGPMAPVLLQRLAGCGQAVVPVFIADRGLDFAHVQQAAALGFDALMVDTADKEAGSLFDVLDMRCLQDFVRTVRDAGALAGLAGALRLPHLGQLRELAPDFAGFRSAACAGGRGDALDQRLVSELAATLGQASS